jgi:Na+-transporting NADH:ubiquinone oxidoreductase subunit D
MVVAFIRELSGAGKLFGIEIIKTVSNDGWYIPNGLMLLPPSAFFLIGLFIWGLKTWNARLAEPAEFTLAAHTKAAPAH